MMVPNKKMEYSNNKMTIKMYHRNTIQTLSISNRSSQLRLQHRITSVLQLKISQLRKHQRRVEQLCRRKIIRKISHLLLVQHKYKQKLASHKLLVIQNRIKILIASNQTPTAQLSCLTLYINQTTKDRL